MPKSTCEVFLFSPYFSLPIFHHFDKRTDVRLTNSLPEVVDLIHPNSMLVISGKTCRLVNIIAFTSGEACYFLTCTLHLFHPIPPSFSRKTEGYLPSSMPFRPSRCVLFSGYQIDDCALRRGWNHHLRAAQFQER